MFVKKRPHCDAFLAAVSARFEVIVFTASQRIYAEKLLDILDPGKAHIRCVRVRQSSSVFVRARPCSSELVRVRQSSSVFVPSCEPLEPVHGRAHIQCPAARTVVFVCGFV